MAHARRRLPRPLRRVHVALRQRIRPYRWWTSLGFRKVELAPVTVMVFGLIALWIGRTIWRHPGERTAGLEIALQLLAASIGGPILVARLLSPQTVAGAVKKRIWLSNILRWPLRKRRTTQNLGVRLLAIGFLIALLPKYWHGSARWAETVAAVCFLVGALLVVTAWIGFLLPRRYTVRLPQTTPVFQPAQLLAKQQRAEVFAGAASLVCIIVSLFLQFLRLYKIGPW